SDRRSGRLPGQPPGAERDLTHTVSSIVNDCGGVVLAERVVLRHAYVSPLRMPASAYGAGCASGKYAGEVATASVFDRSPRALPSRGPLPRTDWWPADGVGGPCCRRLPCRRTSRDLPLLVGYVAGLI